MRTPKERPPVVVHVTEHTINLLPPGFHMEVTTETINLVACYVPVETPEPERIVVRTTKVRGARLTDTKTKGKG